MRILLVYVQIVRFVNRTQNSNYSYSLDITRIFLIANVLLLLIPAYFASNVTTPYEFTFTLFLDVPQSNLESSVTT